MTAYDSRTGVLELQHAYPPSASIAVLALVDVNLLLENIKRENLEIGAWVNVLGYVGEVVWGGKRMLSRSKGYKEERIDGERTIVRIQVQAVMMWGAGGVKLEEYEAAVEERLKPSKEK